MINANLRNFCIIAHIDHGKSTLADRLLEVTGTIEKRKMQEQLLDTMDLERERGITIKLQPVRMHYTYGGTEYALNLIDTPGHVDFHYEVSRSLAAVEGAILLVDATKGVQAQTLANLYLAIEQGLEVVPAVNKIDLPNAEVEKTKKEIIHILGCKEEDILEISGKTGMGVEALLQRVIERVPAPKGDADKPLQALIFDSVYDTYKGVVAYVRVMDGTVKRDTDIVLMGTGFDSLAIEVGEFTPKLRALPLLTAGEIGYIATGLKEVSHCRVGDTITLTPKGKAGFATTQLPGYKEMKPTVYASLYPIDGDEYTGMRDALEKLKLNDAAFTFEPESNNALGRGFRCGFLGLLHLEIIQARLDREFGMEPTITTPSVVYEVEKRGEIGVRTALYSPTDLPDPSEIEAIYEPYVKLVIVVPSTYMGSVLNLMPTVRAEYQNTEYIDLDRVLLTFHAPLMDVIVNFHDDLKSVSQGYASMNYEPMGYRKSDVVKLDTIVAGDRVDSLSRMVPRARAYDEGKKTVEKLKELLPKKQFAIALQAAVGGKVLARETIAAYRKDVTGYMYGGDVTRKNKLLDKQKRGKKRMVASGRVDIPAETFLKLLRNN